MRAVRIVLMLAVVLAATGVGSSSPAAAYWSAVSAPGGGGVAGVTTVDPGARPVASATQRTVQLTWAATTLASGRPVSGYQVKRYDGATGEEAAVVGGCAGIVTTTSCTESAVPKGSWVYRVTPRFAEHWRGPEGEKSLVVTVLDDLDPPVNHLSVLPQAGGAALVDHTVYYRGAAGGSLRLKNTLVDHGSGPESSQTSALFGVVAGWTHTPSRESTPLGGPFVSTPFDWTAGATGAPSQDVTGRDVAGNTTVTTVTFADDSTSPTPGTITYRNGTQTTLSVTASFTGGTDAGSGVATRRLQRASSEVSGTGCGSFGAFADVGPLDPASPYVDTTLVSGQCYRYQHVVTDLVGNQQVATSTAVVRVVPATNGGPPLGSSATFSVLGWTAIASTGVTNLSGNLGISPSTNITGFPDGIVAGTIHRADEVALQAQKDLAVAYADADDRVATTDFSGDQNGHTFYPGVHHSTPAFALTGTMTLDGGGDPNALFIFQIDAALDTAASSRMVLVNGAQASHVFWQSLGAATTGASSTFVGTVLAKGDITLGAGSTLIGRALSRGTVTMADNVIRFTDAPPPQVTIDGGSARVTKLATPTISGTTDALVGSIVRVAVRGLVLEAPVQTNGTWSTAAAALPSGTHQVVASVGDPAGNIASAAQQLTVELNPAQVNLGAATSFSVLSGGAVANAGQSSVSGDVGARDSITGFPDGSVAGAFHLNDAAHGSAMADLATAYEDLRTRTPDTEFSGDRIGRTFHAGVHHTDAAFLLTGTMTLDAEGVPDAIFIFQ
ncbi:MAG: Ice-binding protein, partial [Spirosoma sp.]|nr:Ice-binding protein [Spirosoma sp.]